MRVYSSMFLWQRMFGGPGRASEEAPPGSLLDEDRQSAMSTSYCSSIMENIRSTEALVPPTAAAEPRPGGAAGRRPREAGAGRGKKLVQSVWRKGHGNTQLRMPGGVAVTGAGE